MSFSPYVRLPVDGDSASTALIFQQYTEDYLNFMQNGPVSKSQVKRTLFGILKDLAACHSIERVHCGDDPPFVACGSFDNQGDC